MRKFVLVSLVTLIASGQAFADGYSATEAASYTVNRTGGTAPVIDGVVSPGEWDAAAPAADRWVNLRADTPDSHNLRFQAMWDDANLYIVGFSDWDDFVNAEDHPAAVPADPDFDDEIFIGFPANPDWGGSGYNGNFYIDPNTDGERTWEEPVANGQVDGYQIAWDIFEGYAERRPTPGNDEQSFRDPLDADGNQINDYYGGLFLEAHANSPWGNQGLWDLSNDGPNTNYRDDAQPGLVFAQNASNDDVDGTGAPGAVWEWAISWDTFSATNPNKLVTDEEADSRGPATLIDDREFLEIPDPEDPNFTIEIDNPDFDQEVANVGQIPGIAAFIGEAGDPDLRFSDPESGVFLDNGLYAVDGPQPGDVWGFETTVITNDQGSNFLPSWSEPMGGDPTRGGSFAPWGTVGHGRLMR